MKYTTTALSVLTLALSSTSSAQSLTDLPTCALAPATAAFTSSNCGQDIACICKDQNFINSLRPVIERACSPEDFQKTLTFTQSLCRSQNVPLSVSTDNPTTTTSSPATSSSPSTSTAIASAPSASASNGSLLPGNSTGKPVSPSPSPAPASGASAVWVRGVGFAGLVGGMVVGVLAL